MVRLPGKTRKSMSLCSGGEKALMAISLIFALLKTKPTPFCFLDEVDAPLDEANVGRYNRVLEALSEQFQFVVITHNRRTMEVLDSLYGVTMQEGGVSTVVGVDMKKDLPAHLKKAFKEIKPTSQVRTIEAAQAH
jgi:chromosome segregation protein